MRTSRGHKDECMITGQRASICPRGHLLNFFVAEKLSGLNDKEQGGRGASQDLENAARESQGVN
jgi:hypothetical protein